MYSAVSSIVKSLSECYHSFALCESCFWCASYFLKSHTNNEHVVCPLCNKVVTFIPLEKNERYQINIEPKGGLELEFSKIK